MSHKPSEKALNAVRQILHDENGMNPRFLRSMVNLVGDGTVNLQLQRLNTDNNLRQGERELLERMNNFNLESINNLEFLSNEIANNSGSTLKEYIPIP